MTGPRKRGGQRPSSGEKVGGTAKVRGASRQEGNPFGEEETIRSGPGKGGSIRNANEAQTVNRNKGRHDYDGRGQDRHRASTF